MFDESNIFDLQCLAQTLSYLYVSQLFVTLWPVGHQAPLSVGFSRQEY